MNCSKMSFNRPVNCHVYNGCVACFGGELKNKLYILYELDNYEEIALSQSYDYMIGLGDKLFLFDQLNQICDLFELDVFEFKSRQSLQNTRNPRNLFSRKNETEIIFHYSPHVNCSFGIVATASASVTAFMSHKAICGVQNIKEGRYVFITLCEDNQNYEVEYHHERHCQYARIPFDRDPSIGFRHPTSLCLKNDRFWVADSSNYSVKCFSLPSFELLNIFGGKGKDLGMFDRCNSIIPLSEHEIYLADMNNDRLLSFDGSLFSVILVRDPTENRLNRPVSFSKLDTQDDILVVCRDNNSVFSLNNCEWEKMFTKQSSFSGNLIGYEVINSIKYELLREYDKFSVNELSHSHDNVVLSTETFLVEGDVQDYDYAFGHFIFLNSTSRQIILYNPMLRTTRSFHIFRNKSWSNSLVKGVSFSSRGIIIVGFYTGCVNIFDFDGNIIENFSLPQSNDIFRKVIYLSEDYFLVLCRKMVKIFCKATLRYIAKLDETKWSSPSDCLRKGFDLYITNKELDRVEVINDYRKFL